MNKKSFNQFLDEVIKPIEINHIDKGNLFILFKATPKYDFTAKSKPYINLEYDIAEDGSNYFGYGVDFNLSLPENNNSGLWQQAPQTDKKGNVFKLKTLSALLMHGGKGGYLFLAESRSDVRKLEFEDFIYIATPYENLDVYQQVKLDAEKAWYKSLNLGIATSENRLIRKISNLNPYLLWQFSIESIERQISLRKRYNLYIPEIYEKALRFASANSKYECGISDFYIEETIGQTVVSNEFNKLYNENASAIKRELDNVIENDFSAKFIGKAISNIMYMPSNPFFSTHELMGQHISQFWNLYTDDYDLPFFSKLEFSDDTNLNIISHKINFAAVKQELDWQVTHLQRLLGF